MDNINFSAENIETYFTEVFDSVFKMNETSLMKMIELKRSTAAIVLQNTMANNSTDDTDLNNIEGLDLYTKNIVRQLRTKGKMSITSGSQEDNVNSDVVIEEFKENIRSQIKQYRKFWGDETLNMITILDEYGNERYKIDKKRNRINYTMITVVNDAGYVGKYFDALSWWKANEKLYPELAVRACIVFGKPTHNGFQERVFSRGTYQDTKLKKRLKEENFEMSVLNAINNRKVQSFTEIIDLGLDNLLNDISDGDKEVVERQQIKEIQDFFDKAEFAEYDMKQPAMENIEAIENIEAVADDNDKEENSDGKQKSNNDDASIFSSFSEILCLDGDDDLSIAQLCEMMHLAENHNDSFELV